MGVNNRVKARVTIDSVNINNATGLTDAQLRAAAVLITGALTDAQLRATPINVLDSLSTTSYFKISTANNNATNLKATAGKLHSINAINTSGAIVYLKFYNKSSVPAPLTDNGLINLVIPIPFNSDGAGIVVNFPYGINFTTGISYAIVAGVSPTDNTSITANDVVIFGNFS